MNRRLRNEERAEQELHMFEQKREAPRASSMKKKKQQMKSRKTKSSSLFAKARKLRVII